MPGFLLLALASLLAIAAPTSQAAKPNIIVILVDDMGYGDPACYNPESKIPTPNINRIAAEGMRFTDAHAPGPLCHMSRYGLMTGRFPFRTNVNVWPKQPLIEEGQMTVASLLTEAGYTVMDHDPQPFFMKFETVMGQDWTGQRLDLTIWRDEVSW